MLLGDDEEASGKYMTAMGKMYEAARSLKGKIGGGDQVEWKPT